MSAENIDTREDLAQLLGTTKKKLDYICFGLPESKKFRQLIVQKSNGQERLVYAPSKPLLHLQRRLLPILYDRFKPRKYVTGFVPGRSVADNGRPHRSRAIVINIDLEDFFGAIHFGRSRGALMSAPINFGADAATATARMCNYNGSLASGCPISPLISNLVARRLDTAYRKMCTPLGLRYTRYADDMTFSGNKTAKLALIESETSDGIADFLEAAAAIAKENGFSLNPKKTVVRNRSQRQQVTGLVTNAKLNIPRTFVRSLRSLLKHADSNDSIHAAELFCGRRFDDENEARAYLSQVVTGKLAFMKHVRLSDPTMKGRQAWEDDLYWNYLSRANRTFGCFEDEFMAMWYERHRHPTTGTRFRPYEHCEVALRLLLQEAAKKQWPSNWATQVLDCFDDDAQIRFIALLSKLNANHEDVFHVLAFGDMAKVLEACWDHVQAMLVVPRKKKKLLGLLHDILPWRNTEGHLRPAHLRTPGAEMRAARASSELLDAIPEAIRHAAREHLQGMNA